MSGIDLKGRVVVVTGGSQGLGASMARSLAKAGGRVVVASPDRERVEAVAAEIGKKSALGVVADITKREDCARIFDGAMSAFGDVAVLINNARRNMPDHHDESFWESDIDFWESAVRVNVFGTYLMTRTVVPHLLKKGWGRIVNITTSLDTILRARNSPYGVTKAAIEAETIVWAQELQGTGVTVNSLIPGGACDTRVRVRPPSGNKPLLPVDVMDAAAIWLASDLSDGHTAGRYVGKDWDSKIPPAAAAAKAREPSIFLPVPQD